MRKNRFAAFLLWTFLALACWGMALGGFLANRQGNREFTAYYDNTVLTGKEMDIFTRDQEEEDIPVTAAWKEEEKESFTGSLDRSCQGTFLEVRGEMEVLFPRQLIRGNFPWSGDDQGCVISRGLSWELFGTEDGVGNEIQAQGETYTVRGILEGKDNLLAVWAKEEEGLENFRLSYDTDLVPVSQAEEFLYQMTGAEPERIFEGNLYGALSRFSLFLPVLILGALAGIRSLQTGRKQGDIRKKLCWYVLAGLLCLLFLWGLEKSIRLSPDYFPSMWSDLSFYPQLLEEKIQIFQELTAKKLCQADSRILTGTWRILLLSGASLFLELLAVGAFPEKEVWHFYSPLHSIKEKRIGKI